MKNMNRNSSKTMKYYGSIDGLRAIAAIGIIFMHIRANTNFNLSSYSGGIDFLLNTVIPQCTWFVFLFMVISGFSMCCGYYERLMNNQISIITFYEKRYKKILPFFALLVLIDFIMAPSFTSVYEAFADLTLTFGLLPNAGITVIGVGWTLGVIFLFYMLFPFFVFLIKNITKAWISLTIAIVYNIICTVYFFDSNHVLKGFSSKTNILFCAMFFLAGGLIYLYRDTISKKMSEAYRWRLILLTITIGSWMVFFIHPCDAMIKGSLLGEILSNGWYLVTFSLTLIYAVGNDSKLLNNRITNFISGVSMEIYLAHMVVFRGVERLGIVNFMGGANGEGGIAGYLLLTLLITVGTIVFAVVVKRLFRMAYAVYCKIKMALP